jgi:O-acetyl-ADP-ribose deacetylase (regulator of RNase III)
VNVLLLETKFASGQSLQLVQGDITIETTDAIVNAANERLQHEGGVAWRISQRGGPVIQTESDAWVRSRGPVRHDAPAWTSGGNLPCRYVIHAVGPVWDGTAEADAKLAAAVAGSLRVAEELGLASVSMPAISTGIFGFPKERAAGIIFSALRGHFRSSSGLQLARLVLFDSETVAVFEKVWHDHFGAEP